MIGKLFKKKSIVLQEKQECPETVIVKSTVKSKLDVIDLVKILVFNILGYTNISIMLISNDALLNKLSKDEVRYDAFLEPAPLAHTYNLIIRSNLDKFTIREILCHEMCHLDQYERGDLKKIGKEVYWKNKKYDNSINYWDRPWEKEAKIRQFELLDKYKKLIK